MPIIGHVYECFLAVSSSLLLFSPTIKREAILTRSDSSFYFMYYHLFSISTSYKNSDDDSNFEN